MSRTIKYLAEEATALLEKRGRHKHSGESRGELKLRKAALADAKDAEKRLEDIRDKLYRFRIDVNGPMDALHDVLDQLRSYAGYAPAQALPEIKAAIKEYAEVHEAVMDLTERSDFQKRLQKVDDALTEYKEGWELTHGAEGRPLGALGKGWDKLSGRLPPARSGAEGRKPRDGARARRPHRRTGRPWV